MYKINGISPSGSGERLLLKLVTPEGDTETLSISCEAYRRLGLAKGEISDETYERLTDASEYEDALIRGMRILGYGANSPKQLQDKLRRAGVSSDTAKKVVCELSRRGYLNESEDAIRIADSLIKKGYGAKRILSSLRAKGYSDKALQAVLESFDDVNFLENCTRVAKAKFKNLQNDRAEVQKAIAKLINLGYNVSEAKRALEVVLSER